MEAEVPDSSYPLGRPERPADLLHWLSVIKEDAVGSEASDFRQFSQRIFYGWGHWHATRKGMTALEKARIVGYSADFPLYRWGMRFYNTVQESGGHIADIPFKHVRELANYEYPDMKEYKELFSRHELISTPWSFISIRIDRAVTLIEIALGLSLAYLWLFLQEATKSGAFTEQGTIFSAISRNTLSRGLCFLFVLVPPLVASNLLIVFYYAGPPFTKRNFSRRTFMCS